MFYIGMNLCRISRINFQKKLIAKAGLLKDNKPMPCRIYLLERGTDKDYFKTQGQVWKKAKYLEPVENSLQSRKNNINDVYESSIYAIEDLKGKCLGYCEYDTDDKDKNILITLEVHPRYSVKNEKRKIKYIGETLLAFLAKLTAIENKRKLLIFLPVKSAEQFYEEKCGFKKLKGSVNMEMESKNFDALIAQNKTHTKQAIEILA